MKKGIRGHDVQASGLKNVCRKCAENDLEYLQLVLEKSIEGFGFGNFSKEYAEDIKTELGDMKVAVLGSYINPSNPDDEALAGDIQKFKEKIKYASVLEPIVVGTETGMYKSGQTDSEEAYLRVLGTLKELAEEARKYGVRVGIEGVHCFVINTPQKMKRLIDDLDSDNVKVIFDPVNYLNINNYKRQREIINDAFDLLSDKICVIHAKDFAVENGEFKAARPAEGMLDYRLIFRRLNGIKADIPVICEEINEKEAAAAFEKLSEISLA